MKNNKLFSFALLSLIFSAHDASGHPKKDVLQKEASQAQPRLAEHESHEPTADGNILQTAFAIRETISSNEEAELKIGQYKHPYLNVLLFTRDGEFTLSLLAIQKGPILDPLYLHEQPYEPAERENGEKFGLDADIVFRRFELPLSNDYYTEHPIQYRIAGKSYTIKLPNTPRALRIFFGGNFEKHSFFNTVSEYALSTDLLLLSRSIVVTKDNEHMQLLNQKNPIVNTERIRALNESYFLEYISILGNEALRNAYATIPTIHCLGSTEIFAYYEYFAKSTQREDLAYKAICQSALNMWRIFCKHDLSAKIRLPKPIFLLPNETTHVDIVPGYVIAQIDTTTNVSERGVFSSISISSIVSYLEKQKDLCVGSNLIVCSRTPIWALLREALKSNQDLQMAALELENKDLEINWKNDEHSSSNLVLFIEFLFSAKKRFNLNEIFLIANNTKDNTIFTLKDSLGRVVKVIHSTGTCPSIITRTSGLAATEFSVTTAKMQMKTTDITEPIESRKPKLVERKIEITPDYTKLTQLGTCSGIFHASGQLKIVQEAEGIVKTISI